MVKAEWGAKHGCPKCGTRFYDLGKDDPITCIECGYAWHQEAVLKSKQPIPYEELQKKEAEGVADVDLADAGEHLRRIDKVPVGSLRACAITLAASWLSRWMPSSESECTIAQPLAGRSTSAMFSWMPS